MFTIGEAATTVAIVALALALGILFQRTDPKSGRPKKKVYWDLISGKPISPKHQRPQTIGDKYPGLASDADRHFFYYFSDFGDVLNWWFADTSSRWRVQELGDTELFLGSYDEPNFGRRYEVFCGPIKLGTLEIQAAYPYNSEERKVRASIGLTWVRLLSWDTVTGFLGAVSEHICSRGDNTNSDRLHAAMSRSLWDSLSIDEEDLGLKWGDLEVDLVGNADFYFDRRDSQNFRENLAEQR